MKLGFYYSQAQDRNNGGSAYGGKWDPAQQHDMDDYIDKIAGLLLPLVLDCAKCEYNNTKKIR
jgi:hypothetical protein